MLPFQFLDQALIATLAELKSAPRTIKIHRGLELAEDAEIDRPLHYKFKRELPRAQRKSDQNQH